MIRMLPLLGLLVVLGGPPSAALGVGEYTGTVLIDSGSTICDTAEDLIIALRAHDGEQVLYPLSCGILSGSLFVVMKVVDHYTTAKNTYAVMMILFLPLSHLGIQYGWMLDPEKQEGASA